MAMNVDSISASRPAVTPIQSADESQRLRAGDQFSALVLEAENNHDALIRFGQSRAYARLPLPVVNGQEIQIHVTSDGKGGIRLMMIPPQNASTSSSLSGQWEITPFEILSGKSADGFLHSLTPGATVQARVTGFERNGQTLMDFGSFKVFAQIDGPVQQGQHLTLTVTQVDPNLALRVMGSPSASSSPSSVPGMAPLLSRPPTTSEINALRETIGVLLRNPPPSGHVLSDPVRSAISHLQTLLTPLPVSGSPESLMSGIQNAIENSGLYFEKKLDAMIRTLPPESTVPSLSQDASIRSLIAGDMKPNLLILNQFLDTEVDAAKGSDRSFLETLKNVVDRALAGIEHQQQAAVQKPMDPSGFQVFSHLLVLPDSRQNAQLRVYYAKKGAEEENRAPRISLLLDMDQMGMVRSDLWMVEKDLNITFFVENDPVKTAITDAVHTVKAELNRLFNTVAVNVIISEKKIEEVEGEEWLETSHKQVDLTV